MARNQEKARSMLFKFREAQMAELGYAPIGGRKPGFSQDVKTIRECEIYRTAANDEVMRKIAKISDSTLTDFQVRELNDEINRLLKEKSKWEHRIRELGGPDYRSNAPRIVDEEGRELPGTRGYKYFGRARNLPGVRELFEDLKPVLPPKSRGEMRRAVDADYYGYRDDDDGVLLAVEAEHEANNGVQTNQLDPFGDGFKGLYNPNIPSQKDIEQFLLARKKERLLQKYVS